MGFLDKAKQFGSKTVEEGKKYTEITKINVEINVCEDQIKEAERTIGKIVIEKGLPIQENEAITEQLQKIEATKAKIAAANEQIRKIKGVTTCPECGEDVPQDKKFCGKCGAAIVCEEAPAPEPEENDNKCPECGSDITSEMSFCTACGNKLK